MKYQYRITHINRAEHWISLSSNDEFDYEEPDSFIHFLQRIRDSVGGKIVDIGDTRYMIQNDGFGLIYQWDSCFGISVIYPDGVTDECATNFLKNYF